MSDYQTAPQKRVSYDEFMRLVDRLISAVGHDYDAVVSINRGGLPVGVELSHTLQLPHGVLSARSYDGDERKGLDWHGSILDHLEGGHVLLVDDIVDTGYTMEAADAHLAEHGFTLESAALHVKPARAFHPDYYAEETPDWVIYPWEVEP